MQEWLEFVGLETEKRLAQPGFDVYEPRLTAKPKPTPGFELVPWCIYFHYVRFDSDGKLFVTHYCWPHRDPDKWTAEIPYDDVPGILPRLVEIARPRTPMSVKQDYLTGKQNFDPEPWKHRSYIAIFVDEVNWLFHRRTGPTGRPSIAFDPQNGAPNFSFFDARDVMLDVEIGHSGKTDKRSAIYFVNHMKRNEAGDDLEDGEGLEYKFNMNLIVEYATANKPGALVAIDPGGNNLGPPQRPPG